MTETLLSGLSHLNPSAPSICVYCGARDAVAQHYRDAASAVAAHMARCGAQLVYGGGRTGLMGEVSAAARAHGVRVVGIIPQSLVEREVANTACDELIVVPNMHARKAQMAERSQAFLALPGGVGTLEELFEVWTWRQLGYHHKPIGILNVGGYYDNLLRFLDNAQQEGFIGRADRDLVFVENNPEKLVDAIMAAIQNNPAQNENLRPLIENI